jgi:hypothetical protein
MRLMKRRTFLLGGGACVGLSLSRARASQSDPVPDTAARDGWRLVSDLTFGSQRSEATVRDRATLCKAVYFYDQFRQKNNGGGNYLADNMAPPECDDPGPCPVYSEDYPFHEIGPNSLKCFVKPKDKSASSVSPTPFGTPQPVGASGFRLKTPEVSGGLGANLGIDVCWETRCRLSSPFPYYWWALWISAEKWIHGPELDVPESFGFDNGFGRLNFNGRLFHTNSVGGHDRINARNWEPYVPLNFRSLTDWHTFTTIYDKMNNWRTFVDGALSNSGVLWWNVGGERLNEPLRKPFFLIDNSWGHHKTESVNPRQVNADIFRDVYYEYEFTRIWTRG